MYVPPPDAGSRDQILRLELAKVPTAALDPACLEEQTLARLVELTAGFSGAEVVGACSEALMLAVERGEQQLQLDTLCQAVQAISPQISPSMLQFYHNYAATV